MPTYSIRIVYSEKENTFSVHQRNLQFLATELYKVSNGLSPDLMKTYFH